MRGDKLLIGVIVLTIIMLIIALALSKDSKCKATGFTSRGDVVFNCEEAK